MGSWIWWLKLIVIGVLSLFFLVFGLEILIGAYSLDHPQIFVMYFFSGSFIILVSLIGLIYPLCQVYTFLNPPQQVLHEDE